MAGKVRPVDDGSPRPTGNKPITIRKKAFELPPVSSSSSQIGTEHAVVPIDDMSTDRGEKASLISSGVTASDVHEINTGMTATVTLGLGSINALTYRSFVDPQEARPDLAYYGEGGRNRFSKEQMDNPKLKLESSRANTDAMTNVLNPTPEASDEVAAPEETPPKPPAAPKKFGTWEGVFTSCCLNIFGVIMFLRLGWVVGQAGLPNAILIIMVSTVVTTLTTLSMSAICTNGEIQAGGAYYLISRAIGPKIGGAVGILFSLGLTVAIAMYIIGFCETLVEMLMAADISITGTELNDIRLTGILVLIIIVIMAYIGTGWVMKLQIGLLVLLMCSILSFIIGAFRTVDPSNGISGFGSDALSNNMSPVWQEQKGVQYGFFQVFGVFFPAVTGIMAGANISGDLLDPRAAIPKGTLWAIGFSTSVYIFMAFLCAAAVQPEVYDPKTNATLVHPVTGLRVGLLHDALIMVKLAAGGGPVVSAGIYVATFSSALASLVGSPRVLQMLAMDGILPFLKPFKAVRKRDDAPVRGYYLAAIVGAGCVLIGELNAIAPLITMFFMLTYGLINFACLALTLSKSPGWRPDFKYYTWYTALFGGVLCFGIMVLTSWLYTMICLVIVLWIYKYIEYKAVPVNWGSAGEGRQDKNAVKLLMALERSQEHVKTYRPHYLVFGGDLEDRAWLSSFMQTLRHGFGATIYGKVIQDELHSYVFGTDQPGQNEIRNKSKAATDAQERARGLFTGYLAETDAHGFRNTVVCKDYRLGCQMLMQSAGLGRLRPNVAVMGFKNNWPQSTKPETQDYVSVIRDALCLDMGVAVLRGFDKLTWPKFKESSYGFGGKEGPLDKQRGCFDMWWLADDGGLAVLFMHILLKHHFWKKQVEKVRLFIVVESDQHIDKLYLLIHAMMTNFRIRWSVDIRAAGKDKPSQEIMTQYENLCVTHIDQQTRSVVTKRWLRICDIMRETSKDSKMIVVLLPFPRGFDLSQDYLALIDCLSSCGPPTVMVRGNGSNVLTFKSD